MTDKELADRIVALGVGQCQHGKWYGIDHSGDDAFRFVRNWRVTGAMMEKCLAIEIDTIGKPWWVAAYALKKDAEGMPYQISYKQLPERYFKAEGDNLPRAINEACCAALEE